MTNLSEKIDAFAIEIQKKRENPVIPNGVSVDKWKNILKLKLKEWYNLYLIDENIRESLIEFEKLDLLVKDR